MTSIDSGRDRDPVARQARDLATAMHELRTPLATVKGFLETLAQRGDELEPALRDEIIGIALRNARLLGSRIDALLAYERLEAATGLDMTSAALGDLLTQLVEDCTGILDDHDVEVQVPDGTWVAVDVDGLSHVVANLLGNAARHSPPGASITIRAEPRDQQVVVTVADRGEGIPAEDLPHVLEAFYRGSAQAGSGTGLGLAVVRRYVESWGGSVDIESQVGRGTRVSFDLPRVPAGGTLDLVEPRRQ